MKKSAKDYSGPLEDVSLATIRAYFEDLVNRGLRRYDPSEIQRAVELAHTSRVDPSLIVQSSGVFTKEKHNELAKRGRHENFKLEVAVNRMNELCSQSQEKELIKALIELGWIGNLEGQPCVKKRVGNKSETCPGRLKLSNRKRNVDRVAWRCIICDKYEYVRKQAHPIFKVHNKVSLQNLIKVMMCFLVEVKSSQAALLISVSQRAVKDIYASIRFFLLLNYESPVVGGPSKVVEIDEMYWIRTKNTNSLEPREKYTFLVLGAVEREDSSLNLRLLIDRKADTIIEAVSFMVREGSTVFTDSYSGYERLSGMGYNHYHLIKTSYVEGKVHQQGERKYFKQRIVQKKSPTTDQMILEDLAQFYRGYYGVEIGNYASTMKIERVWKSFRSFYRFKGRIKIDYDSMIKVMKEFEWRYNNKSNLFNSFSSLFAFDNSVQLEVVNFLNNKTPLRIKQKNRIAALKSRNRKKVQIFIKKYLRVLVRLIFKR